MKKIIILSIIVISIILTAQKKYDYHPEFDVIVKRADTLDFIKKDYKSAIELYKSVINTNGDYEDLLRCKLNSYESLSRIYKNVDFEGNDFNLAYVYLKKAVEARDIYNTKAGFKVKYTAQNDDLARKIAILIQKYPGCENGTYISKNNSMPTNNNQSVEATIVKNTVSQQPIETKKEVNTKESTLTTENKDKTVSITVSGSGKTIDEAKQNALRSAIEQAFGAFISTKTEIFNDQLIVDQMSSVSSGNIQSYEILNQSQFLEGTWGVTLKALVSIDKLTSFVEAKGVTVEIKGGLFAMNIKQQILNEQAEVQAVANMVGLLHEPMQMAFDYTIKSGDPKSVDSESKNWEIPLTVTAIANKNMEFCGDYLIKTLQVLSLSSEEVENYKRIGKKTYEFIIGYDGIEHRIFLRKEMSEDIVFKIAQQWKFYVSGFNLNNDIGNFDLEDPNDKVFDLHNKVGMNVDPIQPQLYNGHLDHKLLLRKKGQVVGVFELKIRRTLQQIEKITNFEVKPASVRNYFKNGGFIINETNGHGLVAGIVDLKCELHDVDSVISKLQLNGFSDWRLPTKEELVSIFTNLQSKKIGGFNYDPFFNWDMQERFYAYSEKSVIAVTCDRNFTYPYRNINLHVRLVRNF